MTLIRSGHVVSVQNDVLDRTGVPEAAAEICLVACGVRHSAGLLGKAAGFDDLVHLADRYGFPLLAMSQAVVLRGVDTPRNA